MANISKIKTPDNTEYTVKDAALTTEITNARGNYANLDARLDNYDTTIGDIDVALNGLLNAGHEVIVTTDPNATVTLSKTGFTYTTTANSEGVATFNNVLAGTYTVVATYNGDDSPAATIIVSDYIFVAKVQTAWRNYRDLVRTGTAAEQYPVGTLLYDNWGDDTSTAFRIVSYDRYFDAERTVQGYTHSVILLEEKLNYGTIQFDATEAWLYVENNPLPAGDYIFTIPNYDVSYGGNQTYKFTADASVPVGGQLTLSWPSSQQPASVSGYSSSTSTSELFTASSSNSKFGVWDGTGNPTNLGTIKLSMTSPDSDYGKLNHIHRVRYGSNNYYQSGLRQWLNATTASGWWQPSNIFDRPYGNRNTAGRLSTLNSDMVAVLVNPTVTCITNNVFETGNGPSGTAFALNTSYTILDKLFLVTHSEVNASSSPNIGSTLTYYTNATNTQRIKYKPDNTAGYWWLRTPYPSNAINERNVNSSGALYYTNASYSGGVAAACVIQ